MEPVFKIGFMNLISAEPTFRYCEMFKFQGPLTSKSTSVLTKNKKYTLLCGPVELLENERVI